MKNVFLILMLSLCFLQCSSSTIESAREKTPIVVDGLAYDWENYPVQYNEDWHIVYGAVNTDSSLYLVFSFSDSHLAGMIACRGVTLWLDEDKKFGLEYRDPSTPNEFKIPDANELYVPKGNFTAVSQDSVIAPDLTNYPNLNAKLGLDKGLYCFEFSMPLQPDDNLAVLKNTLVNEGSFGFELVGMSDEQKEKMRERRSEKKSDGGLAGSIFGGREANPGGRMGGRRGQGRGPENFRGFEGKEIWIEVVVAK